MKRSEYEPENVLKQWRALSEIPNADIRFPSRVDRRQLRDPEAVVPQGRVELLLSVFGRG